MRPLLTSERLREVLDYDPATGEFTWLAGGRIGRRAGTDCRGYLRISIDSVIYSAHRLAVLYMTRRWPTREVDHINGNGIDNAWGNLRQLDRERNAQNQRTPMSNNKVGLLGVSPRPNGKFRATLVVGGKQRSVGTFDTAEEAHTAYVEAKRIHHEGCTL